jgi:hypothetical protein
MCSPRAPRMRSRTEWHGSAGLTLNAASIGKSPMTCRIYTQPHTLPQRSRNPPRQGQTFLAIRNAQPFDDNQCGPGVPPVIGKPPPNWRAGQCSGTYDVRSTHRIVLLSHVWYPRGHTRFTSTCACPPPITMRVRPRLGLRRQCGSPRAVSAGGEGTSLDAHIVLNGRYRPQSSRAHVRRGVVVRHLISEKERWPQRCGMSSHGLLRGVAGRPVW